jgi:thiol-disulfide isomerase/thioredoxin
MMMRWIGFLAAAAILLGAAPPAPFDLASLSLGHAATGVARTAGRPVVVVAFASWCAPCLEEMPQVLADYKRFKDRADFVGVDYLDNPAAGDKVIAKFGIPFPVLRSHADEGAPSPADPAEKIPTGTIRLTGVTPGMLPAVVTSLDGKVSDTVLAKLKDLAAYCKDQTDARCLDYAVAHGVEMSGKAVAVPASAPAEGNSSKTSVSLPHLFVVDAQGIVRADVAGYDTGENAIARELGKLGIK